MYAALERSTFVAIFAGEGPTPVAAHAAVGVDDDLATGQAGIALRTADVEASRSG